MRSNAMRYALEARGRAPSHMQVLCALWVGAKIWACLTMEKNSKELGLMSLLGSLPRPRGS